MYFNGKVVKTSLRPIRWRVVKAGMRIIIVHLGIHGGLAVCGRRGRGRSSGVIVDLDLRTSTSTGLLI